MSTKTNFKRVALVAVAALGLGVLTSVSPASAAVMSATSFNLNLSANADGTSPAAIADGQRAVCVNNTTTDSMVVVVPAAGAYLYVLRNDASTVVSGSAVTVALTGPAIIAAVDETATSATATTNEISNDQTSVTMTSDNNTDQAADVVIKVLGAGAITIKATIKTAAGKTTALSTHTITALAKCDDGGFDSTKSSIALRLTEGAASEKDLKDETGASVRTYETGDNAWIRLFVADKYGNAFDATGAYLSATSTNGAGVSWATGTLDSIRTNDVTTTGIATAQLNVNNGGVTTPLTTTVTISLNGAVIGTKTIKFTGQAAKIVVSSVPSAIGVGLSANAKYTVLDSAGNQLAGWASEAGLATLDTNLSAAAGAATSSTTTATVSLTTGSDTGASETTIRVKLDDGTYVTSAPIKTISSGTFSTYSMSLDKAIYAPGEVVTVTIVGKDEDGNIVADGTSLTSSVTGVSWAGGAAVSTTDWDGLTSLKGAWVKKYYASTIVGNYGMSFKSDDTNTSTAVPVALEATYKVADSGVGLPDVLKAMVSLIASINKQIAALQKALLKKK